VGSPQVDDDLCRSQRDCFYPGSAFHARIYVTNSARRHKYLMLEDEPCTPPNERIEDISTTADI